LQTRNPGSSTSVHALVREWFLVAASERCVAALATWPASTPLRTRQFPEVWSFDDTLVHDLAGRLASVGRRLQPTTENLQGRLANLPLFIEPCQAAAWEGGAAGEGFVV